MKKMYYPNGTIITKNEDGSLDFEVPENWVYIGIDIHNQKILPSLNANKINISCNCKTQGGWCNPFFFNGTGGCLGKCQDCRMKTKIINGNIEVLMGGFVNLSIAPYIIENNFNSIPGGNSAILQIPEIQNIISNYIDVIYPNNSMPEFIFNPLRQQIEAPNGHLIGLVNIAGRAIPFILPENIANNFCAETASCNCGCELDSTTVPFKGTFYQCKDTCKGTCTLTVYNVMPFNQIEIKNIANEFYY